jgi:hypothetical protein
MSNELVPPFKKNELLKDFVTIHQKITIQMMEGPGPSSALKQGV